MNFLSKENCDSIKEYIQVNKINTLFVLNGEQTPHGYYDTRIYCTSEAKENFSKEELKKHYKNLLDLMLD